MNENLKFIINEVNQVLKTDFNLISFDAISPENLFQIVIDILHSYNVIEKLNLKVEDRESCQRQTFEALKKIQYRVNVSDSLLFHQSIMNLDKQIFYSILNYIFENKSKIRNIIYLSQFLAPIKVTDEAVSNTEISYIWKEYLKKIDEFKTAHKGHVESSAEKTYIKELRNDISTIEVEKNHVLERIGRIQFRLDRVLHKDVLEKAQVLRQEKKREEEIHIQIKDQNVETHRAKVTQNQLKKELSSNLATEGDISAEYIINNLEGEAEVIKFLVKEKLPKELQNLKKRYYKFENVNNSYFSKDYNNTLRSKIDQRSSQIQTLIEKIPLEHSTNYNDSQKLIVYRQQVAHITEKKDSAAELLNTISKELSYVKNMLIKKQSQIENVFGEVILRGEELKEYVNKLKSKNLAYKQNRTELSSLRAEITDLRKMLEGLKSQEQNLSIALNQSDNTELRPNSETSISGKGLTEILRIAEALKRALSVNRSALAPLTQKIKPLRERISELRDEKDSKKQFYNSIDFTLQTESSHSQQKIQERESHINDLEHEYKKLQSEFKRAEILWKKVNDTINVKVDSKPEIKEDINKQILDKEMQFKHLEEQAQLLSNNQSHCKNQQIYWNSTKTILKIKLDCLKEINENDGILSIKKNIETFILN